MARPRFELVLEGTWGHGEPATYDARVTVWDEEGQSRWLGSAGSSVTLDSPLWEALRMLRSYVALYEIDHVLEQIKD